MCACVPVFLRACVCACVCVRACVCVCVCCHGDRRLLSRMAGMKEQLFTEEKPLLPEQRGGGSDVGRAPPPPVLLIPVVDAIIPIGCSSFTLKVP